MSPVSCVLLCSLVSSCVPCVPLCALCHLCPFVCPVSRCVPGVPVSLYVPCVPLCPVVSLAFPCVPCVSLFLHVSSVSLVSLVSFVPPCVSCVPCVHLCPLFHLKERKCSAVLPLFVIWRENFDGFHCFYMTRSIFLRTLRRSNDVTFHENEKSKHKVLLDLVRK